MLERVIRIGFWVVVMIWIGVVWALSICGGSNVLEALTSSTAAAWVQAVGSVVAIIASTATAILVMRWEARRTEDNMRQEARRLEANERAKEAQRIRYRAGIVWELDIYSLEAGKAIGEWTSQGSVQSEYPHARLTDIHSKVFKLVTSMSGFSVTDMTSPAELVEWTEASLMAARFEAALRAALSGFNEAANKKMSVSPMLGNHVSELRKISELVAAGNLVELERLRWSRHGLELPPHYVQSLADAKAA